MAIGDQNIKFISAGGLLTGGDGLSIHKGGSGVHLRNET